MPRCRRSCRARWIPPTCISSWRARRAGRWRTASSRKAAPASSRAWACARWPARKPALPTPMKSCCRRSRRRRARRAPSPIARPGTGRAGRAAVERPQALSTHRSGVELHVQREGGVAGARGSRDPQDGSARRAGHGQRGGGARSGAGGQQRRHLAADVRPLVRFNVSVIVEQNGRREQGYAGAGGRITLPELVEGDRPMALAREAVRQALVNLEAIPAPAGSMTVVLGPGWPGILLHEAIGHGLEGDFNRKGTSAFAGRDRRARGLRALHDRRRRDALPASRLAQHRRRGHAHAAAPRSSRTACSRVICRTR